MGRLRRYLPPCLLAVAFWGGLAVIAAAHPGSDHSHDGPLDQAGRPLAADGSAGGGLKELTQAEPAASGTSRGVVLATSLTVFVLAVFVGFEVIAKVPPTLHTPLMSGSNAISGICVVGGILAAGRAQFDFATALGTVAVALAMINVVGGFVVTDRMLRMFKRR